MFVISQSKSDTKTHENGIDRRSDDIMMHELVNVVEQNMKKKRKNIEDDQFIEITEHSLELIAFNYQLAKKINIRDLVRNKINGQKPAEKFADIDSQVENTLPKLTSVILDNLGLKKFYKTLKDLNDETDYKVKYDVGMIFT